MADQHEGDSDGPHSVEGGDAWSLTVRRTACGAICFAHAETERLLLTARSLGVYRCRTGLRSRGVGAGLCVHFCTRAAPGLVTTTLVQNSTTHSAG